MFSATSCGECTRFCGLSSLRIDKGKLSVRVGRKAVGHCKGDCQAAEVLFPCLQAFLAVTFTRYIFSNRSGNLYGKTKILYYLEVE
jgi:hypothetical protein